MARDGYMRAPQVVWDGVGRRVLTLTWAAAFTKRIALDDWLLAVERVARAVESAKV